MIPFPSPPQKMQAFDWSMRMPRHRELEVVTGFRSTQAVSTLVARLFDETLPEQDATGRPLPGGFYAGLAVLGTISAGFPSPADEELTDTMTLDEYLITNREATYLLFARSVRRPSSCCLTMRHIACSPSAFL